MTPIHIGLVIFWIFFPLVGVYHETWMEALETLLVKKARHLRLMKASYLIYLVVLTYTSYQLVILDSELVEMGRSSVIGATIFVGALLLCLLFVYCAATLLVIYEMCETKTEAIVGRKVMTFMLKRYYSSDIASLFKFFYHEGAIAYEGEGDDAWVTSSESMMYPRGHTGLGDTLALLNNELIKHRFNPVMCAIVKDAFVREERINRIAFVISVFEDEKKLSLLSHERHAEYDEYFNVFQDILDEIQAEAHDYRTLNERTQASQEELEKMALRREIESLKESSDSLSLAHKT